MTRPRITINMAISLDGKITTRNYTPARFTPSADFQRLLELRVPSDALLVGKGTLEADTMSLKVSDTLLKGKPGPLRCVVSGTGKWDQSHQLFDSEGPPILLYTIGGNGRSIAAAENLSVGSVSELLEDLVGRGVKHLHCEGGGTLLKSLFSLDVIDEIYLTWMAGACFGGADAPTISGLTGEYLSATREYHLKQFEVGSEGECYLHYQAQRDSVG